MQNSNSEDYVGAVVEVERLNELENDDLSSPIQAIYKQPKETNFVGTDKNGHQFWAIRSCSEILAKFIFLHACLTLIVFLGSYVLCMFWVEKLVLGVWFGNDKINTSHANEYSLIIGCFLTNLPTFITMLLFVVFTPIRELKFFDVEKKVVCRMYYRLFGLVEFCSGDSKKYEYVEIRDIVIKSKKCFCGMVETFYVVMITKTGEEVWLATKYTGKQSLKRARDRGMVLKSLMVKRLNENENDELSSPLQVIYDPPPKEKNFVDTDKDGNQFWRMRSWFEKLLLVKICFFLIQASSSVAAFVFSVLFLLAIYQWYLGIIMTSVIFKVSVFVIGFNLLVLFFAVIHVNLTRTRGLKFFDAEKKVVCQMYYRLFGYIKVCSRDTKKYDYIEIRDFVINSKKLFCGIKETFYVVMITKTGEEVELDGDKSLKKAYDAGIVLKALLRRKLGR